MRQVGRHDTRRQEGAGSRTSAASRSGFGSGRKSPCRRPGRCETEDSDVFMNWERRSKGGFLGGIGEAVGGCFAMFFVFLVLFITTLLQVVGCLTGGNGPPVTKGGQATELGPATPAAVLCSIRDEFCAIKKPVLVKYKHYRAYTTHPFGGISSRMPDYWQPRVTKEARSFLLHQTRRELVVALFPFLDDPELGGEAAVLLGAMPFLSRDGLDERRPITEVLHASGYRSTSASGSWGPETARQVRTAVAAVYKRDTSASTIVSWGPETANRVRAAVSAVHSNDERHRTGITLDDSICAMAQGCAFLDRAAWPSAEVESFVTGHSNDVCISVLYPVAQRLAGPGDEDGYRRMFTQMLERRGYLPLATNGLAGAALTDAERQRLLSQMVIRAAVESGPEGEQ
jgi:hypothetical protein